jgi:hypothetical protein
LRQSAKRGVLLGHLYRYPHPYDSSKFIYCGQGSRRDSRHRSGKSSFGRRFKKQFPGVELPQPIREEIEVWDQFELNELETIWMFRFHTWRGYQGGMNVTLPGSDDYKSMGSLSGRMNVESGHLARIRTPEHQAEAGRVSGRKTKELGIGIHAPGVVAKAGRLGGRSAADSGRIQALGRSGMGGRASVLVYTPEQRSKVMRKTILSFTPEQRTQNSRNGVLAYVASTTYEQRRERSRKSTHQRWHINSTPKRPARRSSDCSLCIAELQVAS